MLCPMCGKPIEGDVSNILPGKDLCTICADNIRIFAKGESKKEKQDAYEYIRMCRASTQDPVVQKAIDSLVKQYKTEAVSEDAAVSITIAESNTTVDNVRQHSRMFSNVGSKIMSASEIFCMLGIIVSVILGIILVLSGLDSYNGEILVIAGIAIALVGSIVSWLTALVCYGFGEMVNNIRIQTELAIKNSSKK